MIFISQESTPQFNYNCRVDFLYNANHLLSAGGSKVVLPMINSTSNSGFIDAEQTIGLGGNND